MSKLSKKERAFYEPNKAYKPFLFPWAMEFRKHQNRMKWEPEEVNLSSDVDCFKNRLNDKERQAIFNILSFFTQGDVLVASKYLDSYISKFQNNELRAMFTEFARMEFVHQEAYALLNTTLGVPDSTYSDFLKVKAIKEKHDFLTNFNHSDDLLNIATFSAFTEGLHLFSSFAMLLSLSLSGKMMGMTTINQWSMRDENLHVAGMIRLFKELRASRNETLQEGKDLNFRIKGIAEKMLQLELDFIDYVHKDGELTTVSKEDVKAFANYMKTYRLFQLGVIEEADVLTNPLPWMDEFLTLTEHTNFFEARVVEYDQLPLQGKRELIYIKNLFGPNLSD